MNKKQSKEISEDIDKENKFVKMLRLINLLNRWDYTNGKKLAKDLKVSPRTLYRYVDNINESFSMTEEGIIESSKYGYKLKDTNFFDFYQGLNDISVIAAIGTTTFGDVLSKKPVLPKESLERITRRIEKETKIDDQILRTILTALTSNNTITITYIRRTGEEKKYQLVPLRITASDGVHYLQSYSLNENIIKNFRISKILETSLGEVCPNAKLIEEKLTFLKSRWGFMANDVNIYYATVVFTVDKQLDESLINAPLHSTQTREVRDGRVYYTLDIHNAREFVLWAMKHSGKLIVESPAWIKDEFRKEAFKILKRYPKCTVN